MPSISVASRRTLRQSRFRRAISTTLTPVAVLLCSVTTAHPAAPPTVHSVSDISHEFTFYLDGRFHRQYLAEHGRDARNWGTLSKLDLSNTNLLVLVGGNERVPYSEASIDHVTRFLERDGGTVLLMIDGGTPMPPGAAIARRFGAAPTTDRARPPLRGRGEVPSDRSIVFRRGTILELDAEMGWETLVEDAEGRPVLAACSVGKGHLIVGSRGLFGQKPDASDPINASWITPMLVERAGDRPIDPTRPHRSTQAERSRQVGPLTLEFHEGTEKFAEAIHEVYTEVRPHLVEITGVEPSPGMITSMLMLPTGGGGFSSGRRIAIGAWWGDYPNRRYPMVELIAHEAGHSWVLPHAEPLWNEPIATWLGIETGRRLGFAEADATIARQIAKAKRHDPNLDAVDPLKPGAHRDVIWGKSYFVFEELERRHGPGAMAKYFRTKRRLVGPDRPSYTMDDAVAVWSVAVGEDLFPWFHGLAFDVDPSRTDLVKPQDGPAIR